MRGASTHGATAEHENRGQALHQVQVSHWKPRIIAYRAMMRLPGVRALIWVKHPPGQCERPTRAA